jgi:DNA repair protein RadC
MIPATAERLFSVGEIEVNYRRDFSRPRYKVTCSRDAFEVLFALWSSQITRLEEVYILCLSPAMEVVGFYKVSTGGLTGAMADPKMIFQTALGCNAHSFILAHNHPSGQLQPSKADISLTNQLAQIGRLLTLQLSDHLIVSPDYEYYSFADEGMLPKANA